MNESEKHDLAEALAGYIDPTHPEFDFHFAIEIMLLRPDWFTDEERRKVSEWAKQQKRSSLN